MRSDIDKRLKALESKSHCRIETWTDYVKWCYDGCPEPVEWESKLLAFIEEETQKIIEAEEMSHEAECSR